MRKQSKAAAAQKYMRDHFEAVELQRVTSKLVENPSYENAVEFSKAYNRLAVKNKNKRYDTPSIRLAVNVCRLLDLNEISRSQLAERSGWSRRTITRIVTGFGDQVAFKSLIDIAAVLDIDIADLLRL